MQRWTASTIVIAILVVKMEMVPVHTALREMLAQIKIATTK